MVAALGGWHGWFSDIGPAGALAVLVCCYAAAIGRRRSRDGAVSGTRVICFLGGVIVLSIALVSPLEPLSERLFVAHMTQHVLLATVAPPLLVLGLPRGDVSIRAGLLRVWRAVIRPPVAFALHTIAIWGWHAPALYQRALQSDALHALEHVSFVGTGVLLWCGILHTPTGRRRPSSRGPELLSGMAILFLTAMQTGVLGALLTFSRKVLYPAQSAVSGWWNLTPLDDQRLAGLVMWVIGGVLYVIMMSVLFVAWFEASDRRKSASLAIGAAASALVMMGCGRAEARQVAGGDSERGRAAIQTAGCGACHVVPGIPGADGAVGPPLAGLSRRAIIGGVLPNTAANLTAWLEDPPAYAPRTTMPNLGLSPQTARDIAAYLYSLK